MSRAPLYALSAAISLVIGAILIVGGDPAPEFAEVPPAPGVLSDTTLTTGVVLAGAADASALQEVEIELTEEAAARTTSTTSNTSTTSTTSTTEAPSDQAATATTTPAPSAPAENNPSPAEQKETSPPPEESSPPATTTTTEAPAENVESGHYEGGAESDFVSRINSLRSSNGLSGLSRDGSLNSRARWWAKEMAQSGSLAHSNIGSLIPPWNAAGENVGMGGSAAGVFDLLANSSGHRSNMLGDYTHVGVGAWRDSEGVLWTAHVFAR